MERRDEEKFLNKLFFLQYFDYVYTDLNNNLLIICIGNILFHLIMVILIFYSNSFG